MAKVLVIRKQDKTISVVPLVNKTALLAYNNKLKADQQWVFEEMDEAKAAKLPPIDHEFVTTKEAVNQAANLKNTVNAQQSEIEALKALLAQNKIVLPGQEGEKDASTAKKIDINAAPRLVKDVAADIMAAENLEDIAAIAGDDQRKGVLEAIQKRSLQLNG